jgi:hypothetical protein
MEQSTEIRYLSLEWIDALTEAVAADAELAELASSHDLGLTQVVEDGPEELETFTWMGFGPAANNPAGAKESYLLLAVPLHVRAKNPERPLPIVTPIAPADLAPEAEALAIWPRANEHGSH